MNFVLFFLSFYKDINKYLNNQDNFIYECYISILSQFYKNWEAIFINDGSTDDTEQILKRISNYDSKVKIYSKENGGLSSARNFGIQKTTGDYLLFLDCDDLLLPNCLSKIQSEIEISSNLHLIQFGYRHICQEGTIVHRVVIPEENKKLFPDILYNNLGPVHSFCVKKNIVLDTGLFDETLKSCEDWDFWLQVSRHTDFLFVPKPSAIYCPEFSRVRRRMVSTLACPKSSTPLVATFRKRRSKRASPFWPNSHRPPSIISLSPT